jgi:hypothetical protein
MTGYNVALERFLPSVLNHMIQSNMLDQNMANNLFTNMNQWGSQFLQMLPKQQISESDFKNMLLKFLQQMIQTMQSPMNSGFGGVGGFSNQGQGFRPPIGNNPFGAQPQTGFGAQPSFGGFGGNNSPSFGGFGAQPSFNSTPMNQNIFGKDDSNSGGIASPTEEPETITPQPINDSSFKEYRKYSPTWEYDKDGVLVDTKETNKLSITKFIFPSDEIESSFSLLLIKYMLPIATKSKLHDIVEMAVKDSRYVARIEYNKTIVENVPTKEINPIIGELKNIVENKKSEINKFKQVYKYLNTLPRGMYVIFERIILARFNLCLKSKYLQVAKTLNVNIKISSLDAMLEFLPENQSTKLEKIITEPQYNNTIEYALNYVLNVFQSLKIETSTDAIIEGLRSSGSMDNVERLGSLLDNPTEELLNEITNDQAVLTFKSMVFVTNMEFEDSETISKVIETGKSKPMHRSTCALDTIILRNSTTPIPIQIIDNKGRSVIGCNSIDQMYIYSPCDV